VVSLRLVVAIAALPGTRPGIRIRPALQVEGSEEHQADSLHLPTSATQGPQLLACLWPHLLCRWDLQLETQWNYESQDFQVETQWP
jgi:hypothetical protein